jgi:protein O-GlcNAc transferase
MKKIISFSLWGDHPKYLVGALKNIKCQQELFPDWTCRFYCHSQINLSWINKLQKEGVEIILKDEEPVIKHMDAPGMFWRFEVLKDKDIERCIVRDTDGRLTQREKNCVIDWEKSGKEFHIIRDHPMHNTKIMGGMWGATSNFINRIDYDDLILQFIGLKFINMYATDQEFLARMIYPLIKDTALIHDDKDRYGEGARKIPHLRIGFDTHYIGEPISINI